MADSLTQAVDKILWPFLQQEGFVQRTSRKFVRERNDVFQQIVIDANGAGGKSRTVVMLFASLPFGPVGGYLDPHGFLLGSGRRWRMETADVAQKSMTQIVEALRRHELEKLDGLSDLPAMIESLRPLTHRSWHATYADLYSRWRASDAEVVAIHQSNRATLGL
ncbi:hypothetical protein [Arenimonas sp.]|uniref:hypothetical protein n=1 Tax=Arenimonas sp. TaxID=1872635 RepID=UPI0039E543DC